MVCKEFDWRRRSFIKGTVASALGVGIGLKTKNAAAFSPQVIFPGGLENPEDDSPPLVWSPKWLDDVVTKFAIPNTCIPEKRYARIGQPYYGLPVRPITIEDNITQEETAVVLWLLAKKMNIPVQVVLSLAKVESNLEHWRDGQVLISEAGALGLMQIIFSAHPDLFPDNQAGEKLTNDLTFNACGGCSILEKYFWWQDKAEGIDRSDPINWEAPVKSYNPGAADLQWERVLRYIQDPPINEMTGQPYWNLDALDTKFNMTDTS